MQTVWNKALLLATLLTVATMAHSAATVDVTIEPALPPLQSLDDTYLIALADAAIAASQAPPAPQSISPIPEPPVYIMLLVGVGLLGLVARRETIPPIFKTDQD
ncbi:PEP-CTERM sorting domain-containing protein [Pseudoduganella rivuli]|uniref:PEP-CTERM sorting domain-containing protein n=1 Tax=Pseudoduganella rivuli TaxID=2666085 RepID=UPI001E2E1833|nr:PEP-CTERM sorting domain-containing protein [Pseudoduganella rivuli]